MVSLHKAPKVNLIGQNRLLALPIQTTVRFYLSTRLQNDSTLKKFSVAKVLSLTFQDQVSMEALESM